VSNKSVSETTGAWELLNKCFELLTVNRFQEIVRDHVYRLRKKYENGTAQVENIYRETETIFETEPNTYHRVEKYNDSNKNSGENSTRKRTEIG
jgi:hypothetical protein